MYQCFHCGKMAVGWVGDFNSEDYGYPEGGLVHVCHCSNCGADIIYHLPAAEDSEEEED